MSRNRVCHNLLSVLFALLLLIPASGLLGRADRALSQAPTAASWICHFTGSLGPGEMEDPRCPLFGQASRDVNIKLSVTSNGGAGSLDLAYIDGSGATAFTEVARSDETLWTSTSLKAGSNAFALENLGGSILGYEIWVYPVDAAPFIWEGQSQGAGSWRSGIRLDFPTAGIYTFTSTATAGRYQFAVNSDYALETVESGSSVSFYVMAGVHDLNIWPDAAAPTTLWSLAISGPGAGADTLPYTANGGDIGGVGNPFAEEWIPLYLYSSTQANFRIEVEGNSADTLTAELYASASATPFQTVTGIFGGETLWWTSNLPAGLTRIRVVAASAAPLGYTLEATSLPAVASGSAVSWQGAALGASANTAEVRFRTTAGGLYDFTYGVDAGRYQFTTDSGALLQKTAEQDGLVRAYLAAGEHTLTVIQDPAAAQTTWSLDVAYAGPTPDVLPYIRSGGQLGGSGNAFVAERLPIFTHVSTPVNVRLDVIGDLDDGMQATMTAGSTGLASYTSPVVYGGESFWWTQDLAAGVNQLHLRAEAGNTGALSYVLTVEQVNTPPAAWSGIAKAGSGHSAVRLQVPVAGTYQVTLDTGVGFAQVVVDGDTVPNQIAALSGGHRTEFDIPLTAGDHTFTILQATTEPTTTWALDVVPVTAGAVIGQFTGDLTPNETVNPLLPVIGQSEKDVNFQLRVPEVVGEGDLTLTLTDAAGTIAFTGTALDGETLWGTARLTAGNNIFEFANGGVALSYELTVYEITGTPFSWDSVSDEDGNWDAHATVHFPSSGLYDFTYTVPEGRFQFTVGEALIRKTVEATGTVRYYVPAGQHLITVTPDRDTDTVWAMEITAAGIPADPLPYVRSGGVLGATFVEEWLPLNLTSGRPTNFILTLTGEAAPPSATVDVYLYAGLDPVPVSTVTGVQAGERLWWTQDLQAGLNRMHLVASDGAYVEYELEVLARPGLPASWEGVSFGGANNSQLRFQVGTAGLYDIDFEAGTGRYQAVLTAGGNETARKTVGMDSSIRIYLAAGTHTLTLEQDPGTGAAWEIAIAPAGIAGDTLPYTQMGGELGGPGNPLSEDLLPMMLAGGGPANFELKLDTPWEPGGADGLRVFLYTDITAGPVYTTELAYSGETVWWTADLATGTNWVRVAAGSGNAAPLTYELTVHPVPTAAYNTPISWGGLSHGDGMNSRIWIDTPAPGTYRVEMAVTEGFANIDLVQVEHPQGAQMLSGSYMAFDVQLEEGTYLFTVLQSETRPINTWVATVTLSATPAPTLVSVTPDTVVNDANRTITLTGTNFWAGAEVELGTLRMADVTRLNPTTLSVVVPAGTPAGLYDITVTNPDEQSATLTNALTVRLPAPRLTGVTPALIANDVDRTVTVTGNFFQSGAAISLNDTPLVTITFANATTLSFIVPAGTPAGVYDITVTNPDGQSATLADALTITLPAPVLTGLAPADVTNSANRTIALSGGFFQSGATVRINTLTMGGVTLLSASSLSFVVPAGTAAGLYDVTVTNPDGRSATLTGALTIRDDVVEETTHAIFVPLVNRAP